MLQVLAVGVRMIPNIRQRFTAYVVFSGSETRSFWRVFVRRGWRHVQVIVPMYYPEPRLTADVYSLVINPVTYAVKIDYFWLNPRKMVDEMLKDGCTAVIEVPVDIALKDGYIPRGLLTCVSLVKAIIGVRAWYVWTPYHLARYLIRHGGTLIKKGS